jgi:type VI secretion system protein ImpC
MNDHRPVRVTWGDLTGGLPEVKPTVLRLLVVGNFSASGEGAQPDSPRRIDRDSFNTTLGQIAGEVSVQVRLGGATGSEQWVTIPLETIKSFRPEAIARAIPEIAELLDARQTVAQLERGELAEEAFRRRLEGLRLGSEISRQVDWGLPKTKDQPAGVVRQAPEKRTTDQKEKDRQLDSIFEMVDLPAESVPEEGPSERASALDDVVSGISAPARSIDAGLSRQITSALDEVIGDGVQHVLSDPEFHRLEASWRGLQFLVDRTDFRQPITIDLLSVAKSDLVEGFRAAMSEGKPDDGKPYTVIIGDYDFDYSAPDMEILRSMTELAEEVQVPFVSSVGLGFLGLESIEEFEGLSYLPTLLSEPQYAKWRGLRETQASRWLALCFNGFLLRSPCDPSKVPAKGFEFTERVELQDDYLWGDPAYAAASLITKSFAALGRCFPITGPEHGAIDDLVVRETQTPDGETAAVPLQVLMSPEQMEDFADNGILALGCEVDTDAAVVRYAPSVHLPERYSDSEETDRSRRTATLTYQIFAAGLVHRVSKVVAEVTPELTDEDVGRRLLYVVAAYLSLHEAVPDDAILIGVSVPPDQSDRRQVSLTVNPVSVGLADMPPVTLQFQLPVAEDS